MMVYQNNDTMIPNNDITYIKSIFELLLITFMILNNKIITRLQKNGIYLIFSKYRNTYIFVIIHNSKESHVFFFTKFRSTYSYMHQKQFSHHKSELSYKIKVDIPISLGKKLHLRKFICYYLI